MKTLYESIIQSRFGDHKIEESILDADAPDRLENDVKAGIKRQKLIQEVLKPIEDVIKMYHFSTQGIKSTYADVYGLSGSVYWYEFESTGKTAQDKKGVGVFQNKLKQSYRKYSPENIDRSNASYPTSQFTFEDLGISIFICFMGISGVAIRLCYRANDKQVDKYVMDMVDKYTESF